MANIASQRKRIARSARERRENLRFASAVKTQMKRLEKAVASGDDAAADDEHRKLISRVDKAIQKGAMHRNTGARKKARAARVRAGEVGAQQQQQQQQARQPASEPADAAAEEPSAGAAEEAEPGESGAEGAEKP